MEPGSSFCVHLPSLAAEPARCWPPHCLAHDHSRARSRERLESFSALLFAPRRLFSAASTATLQATIGWDGLQKNSLAPLDSSVALRVIHRNIDIFRELTLQLFSLSRVDRAATLKVTVPFSTVTGHRNQAPATGPVPCLQYFTTAACLQMIELLEDGSIFGSCRQLPGRHVHLQAPDEPQGLLDQADQTSFAAHDAGFMNAISKFHFRCSRPFLVSGLLV